MNKVNNTNKTGLNAWLRMRALAAAIAVIVVVCSASAHPQVRSAPRGGPAASWRVIGTTDAAFKADHDGIVVQGPFNDFRRIKFKVTGAPLNLQRLLITYDSGVPEPIGVRHSIPEGGESRQIDLPGAGKRRVRRVDFWYDTKGILKGKAHVTVFGMK